MRIRTTVIFLLILGAAVLQAQPTYFARAIAGTASIGDGGAATAARIILPSRVTSDASGNIYVAEALGRIRRVAVDGTITTISSQQNGLASGDDGPAATAGISSLFGITVSGNYLYIAQRVPCNIRRVNLTTGIISNFAGNGTCAAGPDGAAATTTLDFPGALAADRQGRIYITESFVVRRIDPLTGQITRFAGNGTQGFSGDSGLATQAQVWGPLGLAIDSQGTVYISDTANCRIRKVVAATNIITTIAGSATCGTAGDGGAALQAQLVSTGDIALDQTGSQLYLASSGTTIRRVLLSTLTIEKFAGTGTEGAIQENVPPLQADLRLITGVHVDAGGSVLFADFSANRVGKISPAGNLTTFAGGSTFGGDGGPAQAAFLTLPLDVIPEPGGGVLVAESINIRVRRVTSAGVMTTIAGTGAYPLTASGNGGPATAANLAPGALLRDKAGNVYVADGLSNSVRKIALNGTITQVGPPLFSPITGIALDPTEQFIYFSHLSGHRIVRVNIATSAASTFAGTGAPNEAGTAGFSGDGGPANQAKLNFPQRIAVDADGNLYVADSGNHRIRKISPSGDRIDTVAGNGLSDFLGDGGPAVQASVPSPTGVAVDAAGNIFIATASAVLRVDKATGKLNRIAGKTTRGTSSLGGPALQSSFNFINNVSVDSRGV
ncbi:MAG: NHL repeat-containing protein, partial [Acidobacteriota bacterium]